MQIRVHRYTSTEYATMKPLVDGYIYAVSRADEYMGVISADDLAPILFAEWHRSE